MCWFDFSNLYRCLWTPRSVAGTCEPRILLLVLVNPAFCRWYLWTPRSVAGACEPCVLSLVLVNPAFCRWYLWTSHSVAGACELRVLLLVVLHPVICHWFLSSRCRSWPTCTVYGPSSSRWWDSLTMWGLTSPTPAQQGHSPHRCSRPHQKISQGMPPRCDLVPVLKLWDTPIIPLFPPVTPSILPPSSLPLPPLLPLPQLAWDTLEELDWCLKKLESEDSTKSMGIMAQDKFRRILFRELSHLSENSKSGSQVAEWVQGITNGELFNSFLSMYLCMFAYL